MIVESLWAITMVVLPWIISCRLSWINFSLTESRAEVASSMTSICLSARIARARAIRCLSPPDNFTPLSPTRVSYH